MVTNKVTINGAAIASNVKESSVDVTSGILELSYYESILTDSVNVEITFGDSGDSIEDKGIQEALPIVGTETFYLKFTDINGESLEFGEPESDDENLNFLYVNKPNNISNDSRKAMMTLHLTSKEFILNDKIRVNKRFDGKISDSVKKIFEDVDYLNMKNSVKKLDIESTLNEYNFTANNWKPEYIINWLSKKSISSEHQKKGFSAGYFFYETGGKNGGYHFKSIDGLFAQEVKKNIIYNETNFLPEGYDIKALSYQKDTSINVQNKLSSGAYSTRTITFDPFNCYYQVTTPNSKQIEENDHITTGGKNLPKFNKIFNREGQRKEFSKTKYFILDTGTLPSGDISEQLSEKAEKSNFDYGEISNQSSMRYNQVFSEQSIIVIDGDFTLHAGDAVFLDVPQLNKNKKDKIDKQSGGLYIITHLCHFIKDEHAYTKLTLSRDSFGRNVKTKK